MLAILATAAVLASSLLSGPPPERDLPVPPPVRYGLSDQHPEDLAQPAQQQLGVGLYRYMIDWDIATPQRRSAYAATGAFDVHADRFQRWYDGLLEQVGPTAQREALVSFTGDSQGRPPPTLAAYRAALEAFRRRYPAISHFTAYNEPNLRPFANDPEGAGALHRVLADVCRETGCQAVAGDFADLRGLAGTDYVERYARAAGIAAADARGEVTWAAHVYHSAFAEAGSDERTPRGFDAVLARTRGDVWITEAGGFSYLRQTRHPIERPAGDEAGPRRYAARDLAWMLDREVLAHPRVKRFYYYQWADHNGGGWDANSPDDHFGTGLVRAPADPPFTQTYCVYANRLDPAARRSCLR